MDCRLISTILFCWLYIWLRLKSSTESRWFTYKKSNNPHLLHINGKLLQVKKKSGYPRYYSYSDRGNQIFNRRNLRRIDWRIFSRQNLLSAILVTRILWQFRIDQNTDVNILLQFINDNPFLFHDMNQKKLRCIKGVSLIITLWLVPIINKILSV